MPRVLDGLQGFTWNSQQSVAYEAALEAVGEVIGAYTALIDQAGAAEAPNQVEIDQWRAARAECVQLRRTLDPNDQAEVERVGSEHAALAGELKRR